TVVVEVEQDVVEARSDEAAEQRQLGGLQQRVGIDAAPKSILMREPEPDRHGACHENAVPAERERTDRERDGARRAHYETEATRIRGLHTVPLYGDDSFVSNKTPILRSNLLTSQIRPVSSN